MQTFLAYPDFWMSAEVLDRQRLGKQRSECKQILKALFLGSGWANHPATRMWRNYENALCEYYNIICKVWVRRGYNHNMPFINLNEVEIIYPPWLGDKAFHSSHRSNLLRKMPEHYNQFGWTEPSDLPYIWPEETCPEEENVVIPTARVVRANNSRKKSSRLIRKISNMLRL